MLTWEVRWVCCHCLSEMRASILGKRYVSKEIRWGCGRGCQRAYLFQVNGRNYGGAEAEETGYNVRKGVRVFLEEPDASEHSRILPCRSG